MSPFEKLALVLFEQLGESMCETSSELSRLLGVSHSEAHGIVNAVCLWAMSAHETVAEISGESAEFARGAARVASVSAMFDEILAEFESRVNAEKPANAPSDAEVAAALAMLMRGRGHSA